MIGLFYLIACIIEMNRFGSCMFCLFLFNCFFFSFSVTSSVQVIGNSVAKLNSAEVLELLNYLLPILQSR